MEIKNVKDKNVLIFTAHPDDHIPCVGTLLKLKDVGFNLYECVFTNGEGSSFIKNGKPQLNFDKGELTEVRSIEFKKATEILGTKKIYTLNMPDGGITRSLEILLKLVKIVREVKPLVVFMHPKDDYHSDHIAAHAICEEALRYSTYASNLELGNSYRVPIVLCFDGLFLLNPQILVDISDYKEKKKQILDCYTSQLVKGTTSYTTEDAISVYRAYQRMRIEHIGKRGKLAEGFTIPEKFPVAGDLFL